MICVEDFLRARKAERARLFAVETNPRRGLSRYRQLVPLLCLMDFLHRQAIDKRGRSRYKGSTCVAQFQST